MYKYILILSKGDGDSSKRNLDQEKESEDKIQEVLDFYPFK